MTDDTLYDKLIDEDLTALIAGIVNAKKRREYLSAHSYKIYQGSDGRWFTRFPKREGGSIQKAFRSREELIDAITTFYEERDNSPTLEEIFKTVTAEKLFEGSITESTAARNLKDFERFYTSFGSRKIDSIRAEDVEAFLKETKVAHDLDAKGYSKLTAVTRSIFRYAKRKKLVDFRIDDIISDMDWGRNAFRKERDEESEVFNDDEVKRLVSFFKTNQNGKHLGLLLVFATGLRIGELAALKWEDIGEDGITIRRTERSWSDEDRHFHCEVVDLPKTPAGRRIVPIPEQARWIIGRLRELNPNGEYVFMLRGSRTRTVYFRKAMEKACDNAGVARKSPHKIRKTYASILLDNNIGDKAVTENMGHTDIRTTNEAYARRRRSIKKRAEVVSSIPEFDIVAAVAEDKE